MKLLLIEDDAAMRTTLERSFKRRGWLVQACADGEQGLAQWQQHTPDVVLLDLSLPGRDGLEVLTDARRQGLLTPVLIITARGTVGDRILGLNTGADDYLPKPFDLDELEARVRALVRAQGRAQAVGVAGSSASPMVTTGAEFAGSRAVSYDKDSGAFYHQGQAIELSPREATMLAALFERMGQAVTKERLFERVFAQQEDAKMEAVEVVAYRLRKKLSGTGLELVTLRGLGYLLKNG